MNCPNEDLFVNKDPSNDLVPRHEEEEEEEGEDWRTKGNQNKGFENDIVPTMSSRVASAESRGARSRGVTAESRGAIARSRGASARSRGATTQSRGPSAKIVEHLPVQSIPGTVEDRK